MSFKIQLELVFESGANAQELMDTLAPLLPKRFVEAERIMVEAASKEIQLRLDGMQELSQSIVSQSKEAETAVSNINSLHQKALEARRDAEELRHNVQSHYDTIGNLIKEIDSALGNMTELLESCSAILAKVENHRQMALKMVESVDYGFSIINVGKDVLIAGSAQLLEEEKSPEYQGHLFKKKGEWRYIREGSH